VDVAGNALVAAAAALAMELERFGAAVAAAAALPLGSREQLEEAGRALQAVAAADQLVGAGLAGLGAALAGARERRAAHADAAAVRVDELAQRSAAWEALSVRYHGVAEAAAQALAQVTPAAPSTSGLGPLVERARELAVAAGTQGFADVAEQADALAGQLARTQARLAALA